MTTFDRHTITERHAELDFSLLLPRGWRVELPAQPQSGTDGDGTWVDLARARAPLQHDGAGACVAVSGLRRTRFTSLEQALAQQLRRREVHRRHLMPVRMGRHVGLSITARAGTAERPLQSRLALIEDGGRLLRLMLAAPAGSPALEPALWAAVAGGLVLHVRHGSRLPALEPQRDAWGQGWTETLETRAVAA